MIINTASIAQWLEHWSCKPGVVSSILTGGLHFSLQIKLQMQTTSNTYLTQCNFAMIPSTLQQTKHTVSRLFYWLEFYANRSLKESGSELCTDRSVRYQNTHYNWFQGRLETLNCVFHKIHWPRRDLNTQPSDLESDALPLRHGVHI